VSNTKKTKSFKDRLKTAKLPQRNVKVCLRGDLFAEVERLDVELRHLDANSTDGRMVGNVEAVNLATQIKALQEQMADETQDFTIRAIPHGDWTALQAAHPPRADDPEDVASGYNRDDFAEALLRRSVVEPILDEEDWAELLTVISQRQYDELCNGAWQANAGSVSIPFSQAASKTLRSEPESKRLNA
jgi:hypothetical protein